MAEQWQEIVRGSTVALDIGAHIGTYSVLAAAEMPVGGLVYAFEPSPETFEILEDTARVALGPGRIMPINSAVGDRVGEVAFVADGAKSTNHCDPGLTVDGLSVRMTTVDRFCTERILRPSAVKIDTEGAELMVLRGMRDVLQRGDVRVIVELHRFAWDDFGVTDRDLVNYARDVGYRILNSRYEPIVGEERLKDAGYVILQR